MPNLYARQTALSNVTGRVDYISNPSRQEHLLASYDGAADLCDGAYWQLLAAECNEQHQHYGHDDKKVVQAREIIIALSNALLPVEKMDTEEGKAKAKEICETLEKEFEKKYGRPCIVALHYNKKKNNLHAHLIYSERELLKEPQIKIAPRNLFYDEAGKRHYKKSEIIDPDTKQIRDGCRIVKKGEAYEQHYFSAADAEMKRAKWLKELKTEWLLPLRNGKLKGDVEITEYDPKSGKLPQLHIGTGQQHGHAGQAITEQIEAYNASVREWNGMIDRGQIPPGEVKKVQEEVRKAPIKGTLLPEAIERIKKLVAVITQTIAEVREKLRNRPKAKEIAGEIKAVRKQKKEKTDAAQELREAADSAVLGIGAGKKRAAAKVLDGEIEELKSAESKLTKQYAAETGLTVANLATLTREERCMVMYRMNDDYLTQIADEVYPTIDWIMECPESYRQGLIAELEVSAAAARELRNRRLMKPEDKVQAEELLEEKAEREAAQMRGDERESQRDKLHEHQTKVKSRGERQDPRRDEPSLDDDEPER